jgi:toxin CcdB
MARFDVYPNSTGKIDEVPYLLEVQSDVLSALDTRIVVPLRHRDRYPATGIPGNLMPSFIVDDLECILETPKLAAVPARILKQPLTNLTSNQFEITAALDFLFQGF